MSVTSTTDKVIDITTLDQALGGHGLTGRTTEGETTITTDDGSPVTKSQLDAAIDAHVPPPPEPTLADALALIDELILAVLEVS